MNPIQERRVLANDIGHRSEQVRRPHHHFDGPIRVAEHGDGGRAGQLLLAARERPRLAVGLKRGHDLLGHLLEIRNLVERHCVPQAYQRDLPRGDVVEEIRHRRRAGEQDFGS